METVTQKMVRTTTNINWYVFGAVMLCIGMFVITGATGWAVAGFVVSFVFGLTSAAAYGAKSLMAKENT